MALPRTFVGFSSTDILEYRLMTAWKAHEHIDFDFYNCQLQDEINSDDEAYIKSKCRERIKLATTYIMLIGQDTRFKHKYVRWEAEVALEKQCRIIAANLDKWRYFNEDTCPAVINLEGAIFVPFSPQIIAYALQNFERKGSGNWHYENSVYTSLGYTLEGNTAVRIPRPLSDIFRRS